MSRPTKIEQSGLEAFVRGLARKGQTSRDISKAILEKKQIKVSHVAVQRFLNLDVKDRRQAAQHVAASEAQKSVPLAIEALQDFTNLARDGAKAATEPADQARLIAAGTAAARELYRVTAGEESGDDKTMGKLGDRLARVLADREKRG